MPANKGPTKKRRKPRKAKARRESGAWSRKAIKESVEQNREILERLS